MDAMESMSISDLPCLYLLSISVRICIMNRAIKNQVTPLSSHEKLLFSWPSSVPVIGLMASVIVIPPCSM